MNSKKLAFVYDLDGTLVDGYFTDDCLYEPNNLNGVEIWENSYRKGNELSADPYLYHLNSFCKFVKEYKQPNMPINEFFAQNIHLAKIFPGVNVWFEKVNQIGKENGLEIEHYIISAGVKNVINQLPFSKHITKIFATEFVLDENEYPIWPAVFMSSTAKTEYLYRISKGVFNVADTNTIFEKMDKNTRYVQFDNIVYFGDGDTDVPAMKLVKRKGGTAIGVYTQRNEKLVQSLKANNRVNYIAPADYTENSQLYNIVKKIIEGKNK